MQSEVAREANGGHRRKACCVDQDKLIDLILRGGADAGVRFADLRQLLRAVGFQERIRGDHHIFTREGVAEILNLQPKGANAKPYQVRQVRHVLVKYGLGDSKL